MSELKRAALLLPQAQTEAERETFAAQHLACQLYAGNHGMVIVGLYVPPDAPRPPDDPEVLAVEVGGFDVVLAVAPLSNDDSAWFVQALEHLRVQQIDAVLIDHQGDDPTTRTC